MTITQTIEIPADRRVLFEFLAPKEIPAGSALVELKVTPVRGRTDGSSQASTKESVTPISDKPTPRADRLLGIAASLGDISLEEIRDERLKKYLK